MENQNNWIRHEVKNFFKNETWLISKTCYWDQKIQKDDTLIHEQVEASLKAIDMSATIWQLEQSNFINFSDNNILQVLHDSSLFDKFD